MRSDPAALPARRRLLVGAAGAVGVAALVALLRPSPTPPEASAAPPPVKGEMEGLLERWPQGREPDLVLVLSGQTYGYLQKCGCSHPQKGGLERRYNFIEALKARGWEVVALDLGDVTRPLKYTPTPEQTLTKYEVGMQAMKLMGYRAVGVGYEELALPLLSATSKYSLQKGNEYPKVLAANIANRDEFPGSDGPALHESELLTAKSGLTLGVVSVAGAELMQRGVDRSVKYAPNTGQVLQRVLNDWTKAKAPPQMAVLLYQGPFDWTDPGTMKKADATTAAEAFPQFHIVLCKTPDDSDAPNEPTVVNKGRTMICQVGQKGQSVGVVGVYRGEKGIELYYQRVVMTEEFETPAAREKANPMLRLLRDYSDMVRDNDYLSEMARRKKPHPTQTMDKAAAYAGDTQCQVCHQGEWAVWSKSKHAGAYDALAKVAKHPTGRQFDGECIICHTVGYDYQTGYLNEKTTAHLKNVQCESCHGPASLHVAEELNLRKKPVAGRQHLTALSPWKADGKGFMPPPAKLEAQVKEKDPTKRQGMLSEAENRVYLSVYQVCAKCHDIDNDPKFDLSVYWPHVAHTGLKKK